MTSCVPLGLSSRALSVPPSYPSVCIRIHMYSLRVGILNQNTVSDQSPAAARAAQPPRPARPTSYPHIPRARDGRPHLAGACWLSYRRRALPALASGLEWHGEAGDMLGLGRGRCGGLGRHRGTRVRAWLSRVRAQMGGLPPTYVFMNTLYSALYAVAAVILS